MFFESRFDFLESSSEWNDVSTLFRSGKNWQAYDGGKKLLASGAGCEGVDAALWYDVLRSVGRADDFSLPPDTSAMANEQHLLKAFILTISPEISNAVRVLDDMIEKTFRRDPVYRNIAISMRVACYANMNRLKTSLQELDEIRQKPVFDNPLVKYNCAYAYYVLMQWDDALALFESLTKQCPDWPRPHLFLMRCFLGAGRFEDAEALARKLLEEFPEEYAVFETATAFLFDLDETLLAGEEFAERVKGWRTRTGDESILSHLEARALVHAGNVEEAQRIAGGDEYLASRIDGDVPNGKRIRLNLPGILQGRNHCVPCSVAIALKYFNHPIRLNEAVEQMGADTGVASWRLEHWLRTHGIQVFNIRTDVDVLKSCLDHGLPLLITTSNAVSSHMAVLGGYDDALSEFLVMDPSLGSMVPVPYESAGQFFGELTGSPLAIVPASCPEKAEVVDAGWIDEKATVCRAIRKAVFDGEMQHAIEMWEGLGADSRHQMMMVIEYPETFVPISELPDRLKQLLADEQTPAHFKFSCAVSLLNFMEHEAVSELYRSFRSKLPRFNRLYWMVFLYRKKGNWQRVVRYLEVLLEQAPYADPLWYELSQAQGMLGESGKASQALKVCLDINENHLSANIDHLLLQNSKRDYRKNSKRVGELLEWYPLDPELNVFSAQYAFSLGNVLEGETLLKETISRHPHAVSARQTLGAWYRLQRRPDLAEQLETTEGGAGADNDWVPNDVHSLLRQAEKEIQEEGESPALEELSERNAAKELREIDRLAFLRLTLNRVLSDKDRKPDALEKQLQGIEWPEETDGALYLLEGLNTSALTTQEAVALRGSIASARVDLSDPGVAMFDALLLEVAGKKKDAKKRYTLLSRAGHVDAYLSLAQLASEACQYDVALRHLKRFLPDYPNDIPALHLKAMVELDLGKRTPAEKTVGLLIELAPYGEYFAQMLLRLYASDAEFSKGDRWLDSRAENYTGFLPQWWTLWKSRSKERWSEVLAGITDAYAEQFPEEAVVFRVEALHALGKMGLKEIEERIGEFPDILYLKEVHGQLLMKSNRDRAAVILMDVFKERPTVELIKHILGSGLSSGAIQGLLDGFFKQKLEANLITSGQSMVYSAYVELGKYDDAMAFLIRMREQFPDQLDARRQLARHFLSLNQMEEAQAEIEYICKRSEEEPDSILLMAQLKEQSDPKSALTLYQRYYDITSEPPALTAIGYLNGWLGRGQKAVGILRESLELDSVQPTAIVNLYLLNSTYRLFAPICACLDSKQCPDVFNFCVVAVFVAIDQHEKIPVSWEGHAAARSKWIAQQNSEELREEIQNLALMLMVWTSVRGNKELLQTIIPDPGYWKDVDRYAKSHLSWRDRSWIPRK